MAKKKRQQQGTHALQVLEAADAAYELVEYEHSEHQDHGYALDTAEVLGRDPATIFKTLMALVDGKPVCAVVPATGMLNLKALAKAASGKRAEMMEPAKAEKQTGYVTGGISPLGQRTKVPTFIERLRPRSRNHARLGWKAHAVCLDRPRNARFISGRSLRFYRRYRTSLLGLSYLPSAG